MRTVFPNSMVAHVWAQQSQDEGRNGTGNFYFEGPSIFSYGSHFCIARFVLHDGRRAVVFNRNNYSPTTSQHKSEVRRAIPAGLPVFEVDQPGNRYSASPSSEALNWKDYEDRVRDLFERASRARSNRPWLLEAASNLISEANRYAEFFGLADRIEKPADLTEALEQARKRATEREAKARAEREERNSKRIEAFRNGDPYPGHIEGPALLRIKPSDPQTIQTSQGAEFPLDHGVKAFRLMARILRCGFRPIDFKGKGPRLGHFRVDRIEADGTTIRAGCHRVQWDEVVRIAQTLGLA